MTTRKSTREEDAEPWPGGSARPVLDYLAGTLGITGPAARELLKAARSARAAGGPGTLADYPVPGTGSHLLIHYAPGSRAYRFKLTSQDQATAGAGEDPRPAPGGYAGPGAPPLACERCGVQLRRVPDHRLDEWRWADPQGHVTGTEPDLLYLCDPQLNPLGAGSPYDALNKLAALMDAARDVRRACLTWVYWQAAREYSALMTRLGSGAVSHEHSPALAALPAWQGPVPEHCGSPMRLAPSGWRCRQCSGRLARGAPCLP